MNLQFLVPCCYLALVFLTSRTQNCAFAEAECGVTVSEGRINLVFPLDQRLDLQSKYGIVLRGTSGTTSDIICMCTSDDRSSFLNCTHHYDRDYGFGCLKDHTFVLRVASKRKAVRTFQLNIPKGFLNSTTCTFTQEMVDSATSKAIASSTKANSLAEKDADLNILGSSFGAVFVLSVVLVVGCLIYRKHWKLCGCCSKNIDAGPQPLFEGPSVVNGQPPSTGDASTTGPGTLLLQSVSVNGANK